MPIQHTAQSVHSMSSIRFEVENDVVKGFTVDCEVEYGEFGMNHTIDVWAKMNSNQKTRVQELYNLLKLKVEKIVLG